MERRSSAGIARCLSPNLRASSAGLGMPRGNQTEEGEPENTQSASQHRRTRLGAGTSEPRSWVPNGPKNLLQPKQPNVAFEAGLLSGQRRTAWRLECESAAVSGPVAVGQAPEAERVDPPSRRCGS